MGPAQRAHPLYDHSIDRLTEMDDNRRLRLAASRERVPAIMWAMLYAGGAAIVVLGYLFQSPGDWFQRFLIALLSGTVMFSIFLVVALEGPFDGDVSVRPAAFRFVLDHMQVLEE
jgi:peptidoglycan/LPS O-acetylase OafA/YrhL